MRFLLIVSLLFLSLKGHAQPQSVANDSVFTPKVKAFLVVSGYGAAGGALLGLASMAFGGSGRAIAQGASLGLYAGMIFGAYILMTHNEYDPAYQNYDDYSRDYDAQFNTQQRYKDFEERYSLTSTREGVLMDVNFLNYRF